MTYLQIHRSPKHSHKYFVDFQTGDAVCLCGHVRGTRDPKPSKLNNTRTKYNDYTYQSGLEARYAEELDWRLQAGDIKSWRRQVPVELRVNGHLIATYRVDFEILHNDQTKEWVETKGMESDAWKLKRNLLVALYEKEIRDGVLRYTVVKEARRRSSR